MSFEADLKSHLQAAAAVSALVDDRIHPVRLLDGAALPAVVYTVIFGEPQSGIDGFATALVRYRVQLDCWALMQRQASQLGLAVRDRMNVAATTFRSVIIAAPAFDDFEPETKRYRRTIECSCWFRES